MRCFIGFFGLTRSLRHTAGAIRTGIYEPLQSAGITTLRAGHFNVPAKITNPRSGEFGIIPERAESALLELDLCWVEPQNDTVIEAEFKVARGFPDSYGDGYRSVANLCHQLRSLERLWSLLQMLGVTDSDLVVLLRPDLLYLDCLDPVSDFAPLLEGRADLIVPGWQSWGGLNDRFAFCTGRAARIYATRIRLFSEACRTSGGMHAETFLRVVAICHGLRVESTDLRAIRVRANGQIAANDATMVHRPRFSQDVTLSPLTSSGIVNAAKGERSVCAAPAVIGAERTQSKLVESRESSAASSFQLRRVTVDGFPRVLPLNGPHYLKFLEALHRKKKVNRYLEIGTQTGMSLIYATGQSIAIDPNFLLDKGHWAERPGVRLFEMTSDDFFATNDPSNILGGPVDLAFIDGMHRSEFVLRDFINVERHCANDSTIILHDMVPLNYEMTERDRRPSMRRDRPLAAAWAGDVWRVMPILYHERPDLRIEVLDCQPTGLVLVSSLNARSQILRTHLDELALSLTDREPTESEFWSFVGSLTVLDSQQWLVSH